MTIGFVLETQLKRSIPVLPTLKISILSIPGIRICCNAASRRMYAVLYLMVTNRREAFHLHGRYPVDIALTEMLT